MWESWSEDVERRGLVSVGAEEGGWCFWLFRRRERMDWVVREERMVDACKERWAFREDTGSC